MPILDRRKLHKKCRLHERLVNGPGLVKRLGPRSVRKTVPSSANQKGYQYQRRGEFYFENNTSKLWPHYQCNIQCFQRWPEICWDAEHTGRMVACGRRYFLALWRQWQWPVVRPHRQCCNVAHWARHCWWTIVHGTTYAQGNSAITRAYIQ